MVYIPTKEPPVSPETTTENARKWLNIVRYSEHAVVIQFHDDCEFRVSDIIDNPKILQKSLGPYYRKYLLRFIPVNTADFFTCLKEEILGMLKQRKISFYSQLKNKTLLEIITKVTDSGFELGLFISRINHLLTEPDFATLLKLERLLQQTKRCSVLLFFDKNVSHPKFRFLVDKCSLLFDHVLKYPIYDKTDAFQFMDYNSEMWSLPLSDEKKQIIFNLCGGYLWLISHIQRMHRDNPEITYPEIIEDEMLFAKLDSIWTKLLDEEKILAEKIINCNLTSEDRLLPEYRHLLSIGLIQYNGGKEKITVPLLSLVVNNAQKLNQWSVSNQQIFVNQNDLTDSFSTFEQKILRLLLSHKKYIISREKIAQSLWDSSWQEKYSDWAIDRLVYRLRQKIKQLGFDGNFIKSVKRKGLKFG